MKLLSRVTKTIDTISDIVGRFSMYISMILLFIIVFEVISRRFFNSPTIWTYETTTMLFGLYILMIMPYGMLHGVNVAVDLVVERFPEKTKGLVALVTYVLFFVPFMAVILFAGIKLAATSWRVQETSWSTWAPPLYPIKTAIPAAAGLCLLQGISEMIKLGLALFGKENEGKDGLANG